jgi:hypothetical protein
MKTLKNICFSLLIIGILTECSDSRKSYRDIDLEQELSVVTLKASDLLTNMRYIPLETTDTALIAYTKEVISTNDYFFVRDKHLYMFDKQGNFLRKISKQGQGPGEYTELNDCDVDDKHVYLFDSPQSQISEINQDTSRHNQDTEIVFRIYMLSGPSNWQKIWRTCLRIDFFGRNRTAKEGIALPYSEYEINVSIYLCT